MNVPDVVQALRMITVLRAVPWSKIQLWFASNPNSSNSGFSPIASRTVLNRPSGDTMKIHRIVIAAELAMAGK